MSPTPHDPYVEALAAYLADRSEDALMTAYDLGKRFQAEGLGPDELVGMHLDAVDRRHDLSRADVVASLALLIEMMMAYGIAHGEARAMLERAYRDADDANQRLREVDRQKMRFFANINHELRTPLHTIIGFSEDALAGLAGVLPPLAGRFFQNILASAERLSRIIEEILDLAKVRGGRLELRLEPVAVGPAFEEVRDALAPLVARKGQTMALGDLAGLPPVRADRHKLHQVLLNLATNAHKFTGEGGVITLDARQEGGYLVVSVQDTGVGIAEEHLAHVFEEFHQIAAGADRNTGTGLGLAITKHLIELHDGDIAVRSEVGVGTTFSFRWPLTQEGALVP